MSQDDMNVANGSGAVVRADINSQLDAIASNNSGATEPSTMFPYMWWPDTSTGLLKQRNGANTAWIEVYVLVDGAGNLNTALFDANTVLAADSDNTPTARTIAVQQLVGRITAGNIKGLTATEVRTLLNVENGADVTDAANVSAVLTSGISGDILFTQDNPEILGGDTDGVMYISVSTAWNLGGAIKLTGDTHSTKANDINLLSNGSSKGHYDASEDRWDFSTDLRISGGSLLFNSISPKIQGLDTNGVISISPNTSILGAVLRLYGDTHASRAGDFAFLDDTTEVYDYDASATEHTFAGNIAVTGTVDGRDVATDGTKLDTVETNADVTDDANVRAALAGATASVAFNSRKLTSVADPTADQDAVTKSYVDALVVTGVFWKQPVRVASTGNLTLSGEQTIDGVATSTDRILVKDQSTGSQNGIYVTVAGAWSRSTDADADAEVVGGLAVWVSEGTANGDKGFTLTTDDPITVGSTALTFAQFAGTSGVTAVTGTGAITSTGGTTPEIAIVAATTSVPGSMSAADKTKLDTVETSANNYSHPNHSGDVVSSGDGVAIIANDVVSLAKMANMATASFLGRNTAATGDPEVLSATTARSILNVENGATADQTGAEIKSDYENEADTNAFTDAEKTVVGDTSGTNTGDEGGAAPTNVILQSSRMASLSWNASATATNDTTSAYNVGGGVFVPFYASRTDTITGIRVWVETADGGQSLALAVYAHDDATGEPGAIIDDVKFALSSTGFNTGAVTAAVTEGDYFWVALAFVGAGSTAAVKGGASGFFLAPHILGTDSWTVAFGALKVNITISTDFNTNLADGTAGTYSGFTRQPFLQAIF